MGWRDLDWAQETCTKCGAEPDERCRTLTSGRTTDAHEARHHAAAMRRFYAEYRAKQMINADNG